MESHSHDSHINIPGTTVFDGRMAMNCSASRKGADRCRLSYRLNGGRAGFIDKAFDQYCLKNIVFDPEALTRVSPMKLVERTSAQGPEFRMWMMMRGVHGDEMARSPATAISSLQCRRRHTAAGMRGLKA